MAPRHGEHPLGGAGSANTGVVIVAATSDGRKIFGLATLDVRLR
jgi:hypothetical protein